jgi:hypothetical protein
VRSWVPVVGDAARAQADGHEVPNRVWRGATRTMPDARRLAGTFATKSGPNCFGTVMASTGVANADRVWMLREPFEQWLSEKTRPGGDDCEPGTVMVWRSPDGLVQHAGITLGEGWVLHKPSQGWMSPNKVLTTQECKASSREVGRPMPVRNLSLRLQGSSPMADP